MPLNRFAVPVHATTLRNILCPTTNLNPSAIRLRNVSPSRRAGGGSSRVLIPDIEKTEIP